MDRGAKGFGNWQPSTFYLFEVPPLSRFAFSPSLPPSVLRFGDLDAMRCEGEKKLVYRKDLEKKKKTPEGDSD